MTLVCSGGYLVIDGIDADLKTSVLKDSKFTPILITPTPSGQTTRLQGGLALAEMGMRADVEGQS